MLDFPWTCGVPQSIQAYLHKLDTPHFVSNGFPYPHEVTAFLFLISLSKRKVRKFPTYLTKTDKEISPPYCPTRRIHNVEKQQAHPPCAGTDLHPIYLAALFQKLEHFYNCWASSNNLAPVVCDDVGLHL